MNTAQPRNFGVVDDSGDTFELHWSGESCSLHLVTLTERGPQRRDLAAIPETVWRNLSERVIRELVAGMGEDERLKPPPTLRAGTNRLSPLVGRELAVLFWALAEADKRGNIEAILHGWRELAREERWWLYAKAVAPGQRTGAGWRRALYHALSETTESRVAEVDGEKKKRPVRRSPPSPRTLSAKPRPKAELREVL
jgi:hypothetical protein